MKQLKQLSRLNKFSYHALLLGGLTACATILIVLADLATKTRIEQMITQDTRNLLSQVIPDKLHDNDILANKIMVKYKQQLMPVYRATLANKVTALAYTLQAKGYAGTIVLLIGIKVDGSILAVRVLSHSETPGLGDKIEADKDNWILSFNGLSLTNRASRQWRVKKDGGQFDQFSGATITPRAVINAVKQGLDYFNNNRNQLINDRNIEQQQGGL